MPLTYELSATDLVQRDGRRLARLDVENSAAPRVNVAIYRLGQYTDSMRLEVPHGHSTHWIALPARTEPGSLRVEIDGQVLKTRVRPPRPWTIHLVNHTHTDLGYTDYQPYIDRDFFQFLLEALALVKQTRSFPEAARFRWTIETSYHLRNFVRFASRQQLRELVGHLLRGTIDTSAGYLQMTDLPNTDQVIRSFRFTREFARAHRFPLDVAMSCDIDGLPWVYPAALHDLGVGNLSMAINPDMARSPLTRPRPFWWESPDGKRVLVWNGEIYMLGNRLGFDRSVELAAAGVSTHLERLADGGYPYEHVLLLMSGTAADAAPPTIAPCLVTRDWNRRFTNPTVRLVTLTQWFRQVRSMLDDGVPVYRGHWPDYWAHGLGSAADEMRYARETQHLLSAAGIAASYACATDRTAPFPAATLDGAYDEADLANEHTFGAHCSVSEPHRDFSKIQWQYKRDHFYRARLDSELTLHAALERIGRTASPGPPCVVVHNALPWPRSGVAELTAVSRPSPGYAIERLVHAETGRSVPYWCEYQKPTAELCIPLTDVPPTGYTVLRVVSAAPKLLEWTLATGARNIVENRYYRVRVNPPTGEVQSIYDRQLRRELVARSGDLPFGRIIQEQLQGPEVRLWAGRASQRKLITPGVFKRSRATAAALKRSELRGCYQQITFGGACPGLTGVRTTIRLHEREKRIDFIWHLTVPDHTDPQAAYVAFPFAGRPPRVWLEVPGGPMEPGVDQIPTTCYDFYTVQNFVRVETGAAAVTLVPRDTPLVQLSEISTFHFRERLPGFNGTIVAWLFNNYWHTNFPASQPGEHVFRFSLTSGRSRSHGMADSYRFAYEVANPLRARFLPDSPLAGKAKASLRPSSGSFVEVGPKNVMLLNVTPAIDGAGYTFCLQEIDGQRTHAVLRFAELKPRRAYKTGLYGGDPRPAAVAGRTVRLPLAPRELSAVRVVF